MTKLIATPQGILNNLAAAQIISSSVNTTPTKIAVERLEMLIGHPAGVRLVPGRVHALTSVRRRPPLYLLPPRPKMPIERAAALAELRESVSNHPVTDLYGPDGAGKSTLAAGLAHTLDLRHFPDGAVFIAGHLAYPDMLQALFDSFYESDHPVKVTPTHTNAYLHNLRAWVILDDVGLTPQQIDPILDALDEATVLILGPERTALGRGNAVALEGFTREEAIALFEQILGCTLTPDEQTAVDQMCTFLHRLPLAISSAAAHAAQSKRPITKLAEELQNHRPWAGPGGDPAVGPALEQIVLYLDETDRQLLRLIASFAGPSVAKESVRGLSNLSVDEFGKRLQRLQKLGLVIEIKPPRGTKSPPRVALRSAYYHAARHWLVDDDARLDVAAHFAARLGRGDQLPGEELTNLLGAIEDCAHHNWLDALIPMVRAADRSLAQLGWWVTWQQLLDLTRRTAQANGDRALEAWSLHQLGSLTGATAILGNGVLSKGTPAPTESESSGERAIRLLQTAQKLRQSFGDQDGAALSEQNWAVLEQLLPAPAVIVQTATAAVPEYPQAEPEPAPAEPEAAPAQKPRRRFVRTGLTITLALWILIALVVGLGVNGGNVVVKSASPPVDWAFGDAWNALDNETWTQQIVIIVTDDAKGDYRLYANGEPVGQMFEVTLPLCDGAQGTIRVEWENGESAEIPYAFDSPFCR